MAKLFTPNDIINNDFTLEFTLKQPKQEHRALYGKIDIVINDDRQPLSLKFKNAINSSGVKMPYEFDTEEPNNIPKYVQISMQEIPLKDINEIYKPRKVTEKKLNSLNKRREKNSKPNISLEQVQKNENESNETSNNLHFEETKKTLQALLKLEQVFKRDCIPYIHELMDNDDIGGKKMMSFFKNIIKKKGKEDIDVHTYVQRNSTDKSTNKDIELEYPISRIRLPVDFKGNIKHTYKNNSEYAIFDSKQTKLNNGDLIPARIKDKNNIKKDLNFNNIKTYFKPKSKYNALVNFDTCISKFGISLTCKLQEAIVTPNPNSFKRTKFTKEELMEENDKCEIISDDENEEICNEESDNEVTEENKKIEDNPLDNLIDEYSEEDE